MDHDSQIKLNTKMEVFMDQTRKDIKEMNEKLDKFLTLFLEQDEKFEKKYISKKEFGPVQKIVYGMVGLMLSTITLSILYVVIK